MAQCPADARQLSHSTGGAPPRSRLTCRPCSVGCGSRPKRSAAVRERRLPVSDVDALYAELQAAGVLHDVSREGVTATDFGSREFATLDSDGNLLTFFRWNDG